MLAATATTDKKVVQCRMKSESILLLGVALAMNIPVEINDGGPGLIIGGEFGEEHDHHSHHHHGRCHRSHSHHHGRGCGRDRRGIPVSIAPAQEYLPTAPCAGAVPIVVDPPVLPTSPCSGAVPIYVQPNEADRQPNCEPHRYRSHSHHHHRNGGEPIEQVEIDPIPEYLPGADCENAVPIIANPDEGVPINDLSPPCPGPRPGPQPGPMPTATSSCSGGSGGSSTSSGSSGGGSGPAVSTSTHVTHAKPTGSPSTTSDGGDSSDAADGFKPMGALLVMIVISAILF